MCQKGERADLDALGRMIPDVTIHGWLGDSILVSPSPRLAHVCAQARAAGIYVTLKTFPADLEGYLDVIRGFGVHHDGTPMTARQRRTARAYARRWLDLKEDEGREGPMAPMPHLDFAVCVEGELPCQCNYASKELEFFNANAGVWMHTGGQAYCRGELLKDALCKVLCTPRWGLDKDGKTRLLPGDDPLFHTAPVLSSVGGMLDKVTPDLSLPDLDDSGNPLMRRLVNFKGPYCLEFSDPPHVTAASTDKELLNALAMCVRTTDRTLRLVPRSFEEYRHPERLELARAVLEAMQALKNQETVAAPDGGPRTRWRPALTTTPHSGRSSTRPTTTGTLPSSSTVWWASRWWAAGRSRYLDRQGRAHYGSCARSAWAPSTAAASGDTWRS